MRDEISEIYDRLASLNLPAEAWQLIARLNNINMLHPDHLAAEHRRHKDKERKRLSKENSTDSSESPIIILDINSEGGVGETKTEIPRNPTPREALKAVLDDEHAAAVIEHRQKLRKSLTPRAAKLLAAAFAKAENPNDAADVMIARGWAGFDVAWLKNGKDPPNVVDFKPMGPRRSWAEIKAEREETRKHKE